ncbi:MAG: hypothetical protein C0434_00650 [Xanthomonadaceae bacterium]|nr:hypothetical protein [Xanthomonadaceae bacterium]
MPAIALASAALLAGCASTAPTVADDAPARGLRLKADSALQRRVIDRDPLLDGSLQFAAPAQWLHYDARYSLQPVLPESAADGVRRDIAVAPEQMLGSESLRQSLRVALPFLLDQPLRLEAEDQYRGLLSSQAPTVSRSAQLRWAPAPVALGLRWTADDGAAATAPLRCPLDGSIELPGAVLTGRDGDALRFGGRGCRAQSAERGLVDALAVSSYSASWQRRGRKSDSGLHLLMMEPAASLPGADTRPAPGYELGLSRAQRWRRWTAQSSVALRHAGAHGGGSGGADRGEPLDWSARASLRTELPQASLSASYQRAADPLWFLPGVPAIGNSVELGLGLDRWIARQLTMPNVGLGMVWRRSESTRAGQPADQSLIWTFSLQH